MAIINHLILRTDRGGFLSTNVRKKGGKFRCSPVEEHGMLDLSAMKKPLRLAFSSNQALIMTDEFAPMAHNLLLMHVKKQIQNRALMPEGVKSVVAHKVIESTGLKRLYSMVVLPEDEVWPFVEKCIKNRKTIQSATPSLAALAALVAQISPKPFIVIMARENGSELIAVRNGVLLYLQSFPMAGPEEFDMTMVSHAITVCKQALLREFKIESARLILMGGMRDRLDRSMLELDELVPDWRKLPIIVDGKSLCDWPELYGALFVKQNYSYLPSDYHLSHRIRKGSNCLVFLCLLGGAALASLAWNNYQANIPVERQLVRERMALENRIERLRQSLPRSDDQKRLEHYLDILAAGVMEPHLSRILEKLVRAMPANIYIEKLGVEKDLSDPFSRSGNKDKNIKFPPPVNGQPSSGNRIMATTVQLPEKILKRPVVLDVVFAADGDYQMVRGSFEKTMVNLAKSFELRGIEWGYEESKKTGYLSGRLMVERGDNP